MTDIHFSHFKTLAEKVNFSEVKLLYISIFALVIEILIQDKNKINPEEAKRRKLEEILRYIDNQFLTV
ncbi:hypothetical protein [Chryseobacterium lathyri]|jgi:hypothetical protein|uniref:hypothetical protein n=1 Tax=Chryseobacterium lathyri TaxID=395933 RepID=UPI00278B196F|nr:hypothetical protein [Chryseobacterium lathyri]MDQ0064224.1 hypothetical protein [Chryseobacterium lathyri]